MKKADGLFFLPGLYFGFVLSRGGVSDFAFIHGFFSGRDFSLALLMAAAIVTARVGMFPLEARGLTADGAPLEIGRKKLERYSLAGAALFGVGWGLCGACPGTVLVQIGESKFPALFTLAGMIAGTSLYRFAFRRSPGGADARKP